MFQLQVVYYCLKFYAKEAFSVVIMKFSTSVETVIFFVASVLFLPSDAQYGGYVYNVSVVLGDALNFFISISITPFNMPIFKFNSFSVKGGLSSGIYFYRITAGNFI